MSTEFDSSWENERLKERIADLEKQLAAEKERADYAWRNTNTIERARQEEMQLREKAERLGALQAGVVVASRALLANCDPYWQGEEMNALQGALDALDSEVPESSPLRSAIHMNLVPTRLHPSGTLTFMNREGKVLGQIVGLPPCSSHGDPGALENGGPT